MRRRFGSIPLCLAAALVAGPGLASATEPCAPWPGEPSPLPTTRSDDVLLVHWAEMRAREVAETAARFEAAGHANAAHELWRHALCLDPEREAWHAASERTRPLRVHRPDVARVAGAVRVGTATSLENALARLDTTILVTPRREAPEPPGSRREPAPAPETRPVAAPPRAEPEPPEPAPSALEVVDEGLERAESQLQAARFEEVLAALDLLRATLATAENDAEVRARRARIEVLAGTAALALQREQEARESFARALQADPKLRLDPATTSPKVVRAFEQAREGKP